MIRSRTLALLLLLLSAAAFAQSKSKSEEEAGDTSEVDKDSVGPLRERVRPVSGHLFLMKGRFELSPGLGLSVKDAFFSKYFFGAALTYHLNEDFAVSLHGAYGVNSVSGAAQICTFGTQGTVRGCSLPTMELLTSKNAFGQVKLLTGAELQWSPIYGKLSLIAESFLHFNMYAAAGPTVVMYTGAAGDKITAGGNLGIGFRFFFNRWLTLRAEFRDVLYYEELGTGETEHSFRNQLMVQFGFSMFFPMTFNEG